MKKCAYCKKELPDDGTRRKFCDENCRRKHGNRVKQMCKQNKGRNTKLVECKCPKCERLHMVKLFWVGDSMPRKYCPICAKVVHGVAGTGVTV